MKTVKETHTPTPWKVGFSDGSGANDEYGYSIISGEGERGHHNLGESVVSSGPDSWGLMQGIGNAANAAFIVRACNEYDGLIIAKGEAEQAAEASGKEVDRLAGINAALVAALRDMVDNACAACEPDANGRLVVPVTRKEWLAHCAATDKARSVLKAAQSV